MDAGSVTSVARKAAALNDACDAVMSMVRKIEDELAQARVGIEVVDSKAVQQFDYDWRLAYGRVGDKFRFYILGVHRPGDDDPISERVPIYNACRELRAALLGRVPDVLTLIGERADEIRRDVETAGARIEAACLRAEAAANGR